MTETIPNGRSAHGGARRDGHGGEAQVRLGSKSSGCGAIEVWRETRERHADAGEDGSDEGSESTNGKDADESDDE